MVLYTETLGRAMVGVCPFHQQFGGSVIGLWNLLTIVIYIFGAALICGLQWRADTLIFYMWLHLAVLKAGQWC